jgi:hypothetical protein
MESRWKENDAIVSDILEIVKPKTIVDIGTYKGYSAHELSFADKWNDDAHVYTIDPVDHGADFSGVDNVTFWNMTSEQAFQNIKDKKYIPTVGTQGESFLKEFKIDLLHIDGDHDFDVVAKDLTSWSQFFHQDTVVLMHDVTNIGVAGFGPIRVFLTATMPFKAVYSRGNGLGIMTRNGKVIDELHKLYKKEDLWTDAFTAIVWTNMLCEMLAKELKEGNLIESIQTS